MSVAMERYEQPLGLVQNIDDLARLSKQVAESRYYGDMQSAQQAAVKLMIARELGLGVTAISNIHLVDGKIQLGYQILIGLVKRSGKYDMRFRERTEKVVRIEWFERDDDGKLESVGFSKFDMEDAQRADLLKPSRSGKPSNFTKYPIRMLTARAVSDGFSTYAPECAGGALYTDFEISGDEVATPAPAPRPIASPRPEAASAGSPLVTEETIVDVEPLVEADPVVVHATTAESPRPLEPETSASASTPSQRVKETLNSLSEGETAAVYEACDALGIKRTVSALRARFGSDAESRETLLPALAAAVNSPARVEGEITEPTADTPEEFEAWLTQQHADEKQRQGQIARAGAYGK